MAELINSLRAGYELGEQMKNAPQRNALVGMTLDSQRQTIDKNNQLVNRMESVEQKIDNLPVPTPSIVKEPEPNPEVDKAISFLKEKGKFVDSDYVDKKLKDVNDRMVLDNEHNKYESMLDGSNGKPKYERFAVEEHMKKKGIYNAEAAYQDMHRAELTDWEIKNYEKGRTKKPLVARPSSTAGTVDENAITREKISDWLKTPQGRMKYEQHRSEILKLMAEGKL